MQLLVAGFGGGPGGGGWSGTINQALPPEYAARLLTARDGGATERQLAAVLAEGLGEMYFWLSCERYFRNRGNRARGLHVEFTGIEELDLDI